MLAGTELRKERRLGEVLTDSFNILFAYWRSLAIIAVPVVVAGLAFSLVTLAITSGISGSLESETSELSSDDLVNLWLAALVAVPILIVLQALVTGGSVVFLDETDRQAEIAPADALDRAQDHLGALIGATLRATAIIFLLSVTLIGIPWAIKRLVKWLFLAQVIMLEGKRGEDVLARSAELVQGRWWNTFGRLIVLGLVIQIPLGLLQQALLAAAPGVIGTILVGATGFIYVPFGIIGMSLMFFDLRARKGKNDVTSTPAGPIT